MGTMMSAKLGQYLLYILHSPYGDDSVAASPGNDASLTFLTDRLLFLVSENEIESGGDQREVLQVLQVSRYG
jgi:hypothetical protein